MSDRETSFCVARRAAFFVAYAAIPAGFTAAVLTAAVLTASADIWNDVQMTVTLSTDYVSSLNLVATAMTFFPALLIGCAHVAPSISTCP